jgi:hypothetical protein
LSVGKPAAFFDNRREEVVSMKAGDLVQVHSASYSGEQWRYEGLAVLIKRTEEYEELPFITLRNGERVDGPFQEWHVKFRNVDVPNAFVWERAIHNRWIRESDLYIV